MRRTIPLLTSSLAIGLVGCVAEIPELPEEYQNKAPVIQGETRLELTEGTQSRIELSISDDRDKLDELTINWEVSQQLTNAVVIEPDGQAADVDIPWQTAGAGSAVVSVTVTDKDGETTSTDIELVVTKQTFLIAQAQKERADQGDLYRVGYPASTALHLNEAIQIQEAIEQPVLSPRGEYLAFVRNHSVNGEQLVLMASAGSDETDIVLPEETGSDIVRLAWSPKATYLVVVTQTDAVEPVQHLNLVTMDGTVLSVTADPGLKSATDFSFSADESTVLWVNKTGELIWHDLATETPATLYASTEAGFADSTSYLWHPTELVLAYTAMRGADGSKKLYLATSETLADENPPVEVSTLLGSHAYAVHSLQWSPSGQYLSFLGDLVTDAQDELFVLTLAEWQEDPTDLNQVRVSGSLIAAGDVSDYRWSPEETRLGYAADQLIDGEVQLFSSNRDGSTNRRFTDLSDQSHLLFWDWATESKLVFVISELNPSAASPSHRISVYESVSVANQAPTPTLLTQDLYNDDFSNGIDDIRLSPDKSKLALQSLIVSSREYQAHVLDLESGEMQLVTELTTDETDYDYIWSPNSDGLIYLTLNSSDEGLRLVFQPLDSLPEKVTESLLGDLAPNGRILNYQVAQ